MVRVDGVDEAEVVVGEEEAVGAGAEDSAGTAVHDGLAAGAGPAADARQEAGDEVVGDAIGGREADDAVAGADVGMAGSVKGNEETVAEIGIAEREVFEAERGAVGGEGGVRRGNFFAGAERRGSAAEGGVGIGCEGVSAAGGEVGGLRSDAGLLAVDVVARR